MFPWGVYCFSLFGCFFMNEHDCTDGTDQASIGSCSINAQSTNNQRADNSLTIYITA